MVKNLPAKQEMQVDPWVRKIPWRRKWQPTSSTLAWRIPWTEEPGGLQSMVLQTAGHNLATKQQQYSLQYFRWKSLSSASVKKKKKKKNFFPPLKVRLKLEKLFYKLENFSVPRHAGFPRGEHRVFRHRFL